VLVARGWDGHVVKLRRNVHVDDVLAVTRLRWQHGAPALATMAREATNHRHHRLCRRAVRQFSWWTAARRLIVNGWRRAQAATLMMDACDVIQVVTWVQPP
jgi:hypothetical protein